ncbi:MAG TPA: hypothetical protein VMM76_26040 [Pirellulaceae bacterium]|nr:hypothetical protein [Pirellulaceae bacterium]
MNDPQPAESAQLFFRRDNAGIQGVLFIIGGCVALGFAAIGFLLALFVARVSPFALQAMTTLPALIGLGALGAGLAALRGPSQISVDADGVVIVDRKGSRRIPWRDIGLAAASSGSLHQRRQITLFDLRGKSLVTVADNFSDFELFVDLVRQHVNEQEVAVAEPLRMRKSRRAALMFGAFGIFMAMVGGFIAYDTSSNARAARLLAASGVEGEGTILRHFLAPNGITCRLEYEVAGDNGQTATRNAEVEAEYWDKLEGATTVPIRYVPAEPHINKLLAGEVKSKNEFGPIGGYGLGALAGCMALFIFVVAVMHWYGWDYGTDPKTGKLGFRKVGT